MLAGGLAAMGILADSMITTPGTRCGLLGITEAPERFAARAHQNDAVVAFRADSQVGPFATNWAFMKPRHYVTTGGK